MVGNIIKLGWKNVWRNPTRSAVVIVAVVLSTWAGIFLSGLFAGLAQGYLDNQFKLTVPHIEITHPQFDDLHSPEYYVSNSSEVLNELRGKPYIANISTQSYATGLAQSARSNYGVTIHGYNPDSTHSIENYLVDGMMPGQSDQRNPIAIGQELAAQLDLEMGSRMVLSFQDVEGSITGGAFRIAGIFDTFSDPYDEGNVFVLSDDLNRLLGLEDQMHVIQVQVDDFRQANIYTAELDQRFPDLQNKVLG